MKTALILTTLLSLLAGTPAGAVAPGDNMDCGYPITPVERALCARKGWNEASDDLRELIGEVKQKLLKTQKEALANFEDVQRNWFIETEAFCNGYAEQEASDETENELLKYGCLATQVRGRIEDLRDYVETLDE